MDLVLVILLSLAFGAIGFIDDYIKSGQKKKLRSYRPPRNLDLQFVAALIFATVVAIGGSTGTVIDLPFTSVDFDRAGFIYHL